MTESLSLYEVPLGCEAVPEMGCGVVAKPILALLSREPAVAEAWLNRNGTMVAVVWNEGTAPELRSERVCAILAGEGLAAEEPTDEVRERILKDFCSGSGWYRGEAVDRLSEEEAAIIAARVVRRVTAKVPLSDGEIAILVAAFAKVCRHLLINQPATSAPLRRQRIANEILKAGREQLDGPAYTALQEAVALGHRPVTGEQ